LISPTGTRSATDCSATSLTGPTEDHARHVGFKPASRPVNSL
jgi:hypothetical protein